MAVPTDADARPELTDASAATSTDGSLQISWGDEPGRYEVELRGEGRADVVYRGRLPAAHVSGLPNGEYELRVREQIGSAWSEWSEPKRLTVRHHPMALVWTLLGLGALVFAATATVVLRSSREGA